MARVRTRLEAMARHLAAPTVLVLVALFASGCAQLGDIVPAGLATSANERAAAADKAASPTGTLTELQKATEYWGREHAKSPRDPEIALKYARNLKALGAKPQALAVLQQVHMHNNQHRGVLSEYGRLALELDQVPLAVTLLAAADDPANPDWRVLSARGAAFAKQGKQREAIPYLERALTLAPDQMAVVNNLALAYALDNQAPRAETMLRDALARSANPKVRQNLVIVLSLQGKFDEARIVAGEELPPAVASANIDYLRRMARAEPRSTTPAAAAPATAVAAGAPRGPAPILPAKATASPAAPAVAGWSASTEPAR